MSKASNPSRIAGAASQQKLDATLTHLRSLHVSSFLGYVLAVGQYLVDEFFDGNFTNVHSKDPHKQESFNALLTQRADELAELNLSASTLRNYMAATEVWNGLPESVRSKLNLDHLHRLAAVPDPAARKALAHDAATMHWTRDQLVVAVREQKLEARAGKKKPGRKPTPVALKAAVAMHRSVRALAKLHGAATQLEGKHRERWLAEIKAARKVLAELD